METAIGQSASVARVAASRRSRATSERLRERRRASRLRWSAITRPPTSLVTSHGLDACQQGYLNSPPAPRPVGARLGDRTDEATRTSPSWCTRSGCCRVSVRKVAQPDPPSAVRDVHPHGPPQPRPWSAASRTPSAQVSEVPLVEYLHGKKSSDILWTALACSGTWHVLLEHARDRGRSVRDGPIYEHA